MLNAFLSMTGDHLLTFLIISVVLICNVRYTIEAILEAFSKKNKAKDKENEERIIE